VSAAGWRDPYFDPQLRAGLNILPPLPNPVGGTHVSGPTDAWDPCVRPDRRVGPMCQAGLTRGTCVLGPSARGTRVSGPPVGPARQVGPMRGARVSGQTDSWDPRVRWDRRNSSV
jgi:hypothetical protein